MSSNLGLGWTPRELEIAALGLSDPREIELARFIAKETETQREAVRQEYPPSDNAGLMGLPYDHAATLFWDELLASNVSIVLRGAERFDIAPVEVARFAREKCRPNSSLALFWVEQFLAVLDEKLTLGLAMELDSKAVQASGLRAHARKGGIKSGETRRKSAQTPPFEVLDAERKRLIAENRTPERSIIGKIASKFPQVSSRQIRRALNSGGK